MKLLEAITQLQDQKPNQYDDQTLCNWLYELDGKLYEEILKWHEGEWQRPKPYDLIQDAEKELLVPAPYDQLYVKYLFAQVDFANADYARYNNSMVMYNTALSEFTNWINREYLPIQQRVKV